MRLNRSCTGEFDVFADPQALTYNSVAKSLPAIGRNETQSEYKLSEDTGVVYDFVISHQFKARNRCVARLRRDAIVADPLNTGRSILASSSATFTVDRPASGFTLTDVQNLGKALRDWLTDANILKMLNGET